MALLCPDVIATTGVLEGVAERMTDDAGVLALRDEPDERRACVGGMLCGWEEAEVLLRADRSTLGEKLGGMPLSFPPAALGVRDDDEGVMVRGVCDDARERRPAEGIKLGGLICGSAPPDSCVMQSSQNCSIY